MNKPVDFLGIRSERALRREILNICNSYNNDWDILCEITQNSYDAIVRYVKKHGENGRHHSITLTINAQTKSIRIEDTGTGIDAAKIQTIFYKGIMPSEKVLDFPVDCNTLTGSVNL